MADNEVSIDGKTYDLDALSDECKLSCSLLQEVQEKIVKVSRKLDILRASAISLADKVKETVSDEALVESNETT